MGIVTLITPAAETNLTTLSRVKEELGLTDDDQARDDLLTVLIAEASDAIRRISNRLFQRQRYQEKLHGSLDQRLMLTHTPIVSIVEVLQDNSPVVDFQIEDAEAGFLWRRAGWTTSTHFYSMGFLEPHRELLGGGYEFIVTYDAGYLLPAEVDRTLPADIEKACVETVKAWYLSRQRDPAIASKAVGDLRLTYVNEQPTDGLPATAMALLRPWIRFR